MVPLHAVYVQVRIIVLIFVGGGILGDAAIVASNRVVLGVVLVTDMLAVLQVLLQVVIVVLHNVLFFLAHGYDCCAGALSFHSLANVPVCILLLISTDSSDDE